MAAASTWGVGRIGQGQARLGRGIGGRGRAGPVRAQAGDGGAGIRARAGSGPRPFFQNALGPDRGEKAARCRIEQNPAQQIGIKHAGVQQDARGAVGRA
jgi:hypothetical protein